MLNGMMKVVSLMILILLVYAVFDVSAFGKLYSLFDKEWSVKTHRMLLRTGYYDKLGHFVMAGLIAFFLNLLLSSKNVLFRKKYFLVGSLIVGGVFTLMEIYHYFTPKRNFELLDLFFTYSGIFIIGGLRKWLIKAKQLLSRTQNT